MGNSSSFFSDAQLSFPDAELLQVGGTTCECYRVKLYGKLHFLKRLKPELRTNPQYVAALQKEFELGYPLEHPHLVRYLSKTADSILMDYVDGETLDKFIVKSSIHFVCPCTKKSWRLTVPTPWLSRSTRKSKLSRQSSEE